MRSNLKFYINPIYWPLWLLIGVAWCIAQLPFRTQLFLGKQLGRLLLLAANNMRHIAQINLSLAFPQYSDIERNRLLKKNFLSLGMSVFETLFAFFASQRRISRLTKIHHKQRLIDASNYPNGAILMGVHFHTLELIGRAHAKQEKLHLVYRRSKTAFVNFFLKKQMEKHYHKAIERSNMRETLKALRSGNPILYLPDIDAGYFNHLFAPFFGISAASLVTPVKLVQKTGALLVPMAFYRKENERGYDIYIHKPLADFPSGNTQADITRLNQIQEEMILKKPEEYLWTYKRFKTRPAGEPRFYGNRSS